MATSTETYRYARLHITPFDIDVPTIAAGRTVYFPIKAFCEALGVAGPSMQIKRMKEDSRFAHGALRELPMPTTKGIRETICLRKQQLPIWLTLLDASRAQFKPAIRERLEEFQRAVFAAAERFLFGDMSDAVVDAPERASKPIVGVLHVGDCPRCGLALCVTLDADGGHLIPDTAEDV